jgi:hypothetical protein
LTAACALHFAQIFTLICRRISCREEDMFWLFWLFWQLVGIAIALAVIWAAIMLIVGGFGLLVRMFTHSPAPRSVPPNTLPLGWVSVKCGECGKRYDGVNEFEARRTRDWHMRAQHGIHVSTRFAPDANLPVVLLGQIVEEKPTSGCAIHFAKCPVCDARFEDVIADEARRMRQQHMKGLHGL